jgi:Glu-tRNA(Gln) amidotransferase subunit E-like FAD-binding protein
MSNLFSESEFTTRLGHKILIAGLSEAGKSATKRIFFLKHKPKSVSDLAATINYDRLAIVINDVPVTILDLGGQRVFVKRFLNEMSPFIFNNVKALIYLIDVSNRSTRNSSVAYFNACVNRLQSFSPTVNCFVLLHKNDLVENWPNYENIHEQLKEQFQLASSQELRFFRTTIYRSETVINSFGRIIELILPELARSEFVDGREIGKIEEVTEQYVTLHERKREKTEIRIPQAKGKEPLEVNNLKSLMEAAIKEKSTFKDPTSELPSKSEILSPEISIDKKIHTEEKIIAPKKPVSKKELQLIDVQKSHEITFADQQIIDFRIKNLVSLSKIDINDASEIVKNDYDDLFSLAITSGVSLNVALKIFLSYIPLIKLQPGLDIFVNKDRIMSLFIASTQNLIKDEEIFDFLLLSCENKDINLDEIVQLVHQLEQSRYESILTTAEGKIDFQHPIYQDKFIGGLSTNTQNRINKLLLLNSDLQIEDALKVVENNYDEFYFSAGSTGIPYNLIQNILFKILPQIDDSGLNIKVLNNLQLLSLIRDFSQSNLPLQNLENSLILNILKPSSSKGEKLSESFESQLTAQSNKYKRIEHLVQVTKDLTLEIATKLVEIGYEEIIDQANMSKIPLTLVLKVLLSDIPAIKRDGFNINELDQQKILTTFNAFNTELIKEEDLKNCLTLMIINPSSPILDVIKNTLTESNVQAIKGRELEIVKKTIKPLPILGNFGFKLESQEGNCLLSLYQDDKKIGESVISPNITVSKIVYLLTFELNLPFDIVNKDLNEPAEIIHKAIKEII